MTDTGKLFFWLIFKRHYYRVNSQDSTGSKYKALLSLPIYSCEVTLYITSSEPDGENVCTLTDYVVILGYTHEISLGMGWC